ncbi:glycosyltransferase [Promicromonospora sp. Populi]|uniref:glycosyltransferase n=1 Tax=Promicromonospora sp. Populi TaxID=3239420 RepID=UPI0034E1F97F
MNLPGTPRTILIGAETYPPAVNGAARFAGSLATGLARRGYDVHVVAPSPTGRPVREERDGVVLHGLRSRRYPSHANLQVCLPWETRRGVTQILEEIRPDVVHTNGSFILGRAVVDAAHKAGLPLVATNHLMPENLVGYLLVPGAMHRTVGRWLWQDIGRVYAKADVVTAPTPRAVDLLAQHAGLSHAIPVSNGIDTDLYPTRTREDSAEPTVLFVGRLDQEKRVDEIIRAFALLPADLPGRLEIIGTGAKAEEWTALAASSGVAHRVRLRGYVPDDELRTAYSEADVFCMPGVAELQSLVTLEAMSSGLPVVAADAMALPHLVRPGVNGWLYTPGDVRELANRLGDLLADAGLRRRMGAASRELVAAHAVDGTLDAFEGIYEKVRALRETPAAA